MKTNKIIHAIICFIATTFVTVSAQSSWFETLRDRIGVCNNVMPTAVRTPVVFFQDTAVDLTWLPPSNRPCEVNYQIEVSSTQGYFARYSFNQTRARISGLENAVTHRFTIRAVTALGISPIVEITAVPGPRNFDAPIVSMPSSNTQQQQQEGLQQQRPLPGWTCVAMNQKLSCPASESKLCTAMTCQQVVASGRCNSEFARFTHWNNFTIHQYCAAECGCNAVPSLRASLEAPAADACCAFPAGQYWKDDAGRLKSEVDMTI